MSSHEKSSLREIALYYPYIHFRDEKWLKSAILYWPKIARLVPVRSRPRDSELVRELCDRGIVINTHAGRAAENVSEEFGKFVSKYEGSLANAYSLDRQLIVSATTVGSRYLGVGEAASRTEHVSSAGILDQKPAQLDYVWIDEDVMDSQLITELQRLNLVERRSTSDGSPWLAMNRQLAAVYKCALADRVARNNSMQTITDQPREHVALNGWTVEAIAHTLLRDESPEMETEATDIAELFALIAIETVVPNLSRVSLAQVLQARDRLEPEFFAFRQYISTLNDRFSEIAKLEDPSVRIARLELLASEEIKPKVQILKKEIRNARLEPLSAVLSLKSLAPPAVIAAASMQLGLGPLATASGSIAACFIASLGSMRTKMGLQRSSSPVAYLLGLKKRLTAEETVRTGQAIFKRQKLASSRIR